MLYCRKQESEADAIGMQLAAKACFDPAAAALVFEKLDAAEKQQGVKIPTLLRTHPISEVCCTHISCMCWCGLAAMCHNVWCSLAHIGPCD